MKTTTCIFLMLLISSKLLTAQSITDYVSEYRISEASNMKLEGELLANTDLGSLLNELTPYFTDSMTVIRRKAYYLSYKKAKKESILNQVPAVNQLVIGCSDKEGSIIKQNLSYLKLFQKEAFDSTARKAIAFLLTQPKYESFSDIYLLAGFLGIGSEPMNRLYMHPETPNKTKWTLQLALARMGNAGALESVMNNASQMEVGDNLVAYLIPNLIYTRQKQALDFCVKVLNETDKNCSPPNAELSNKIVCGYRVMEMLAPVIEGYPFETDATGMVVADNYDQALEQVRAWFIANPDYKIKTDRY